MGFNVGVLVLGFIDENGILVKADRFFVFFMCFYKFYRDVIRDVRNSVGLLFLRSDFDFSLGGREMFLEVY